MASHFQRGYAVVEFKYSFNARRIDYLHTKTGYAQQEIPIATERRGKYYAKCNKNETNDPALSQWVKDVAMPKAIEEITTVINTTNEESRQRRERWERNQQQRVWEGKQSQGFEDIKPREVVYPPFDRTGLKMEKPRAVRDKPQAGDGEEIEWKK